MKVWITLIVLLSSLSACKNYSRITADKMRLKSETASRVKQEEMKKRILTAIYDAAAESDREVRLDKDEGYFIPLNFLKDLEDLRGFRVKIVDDEEVTHHGMVTITQDKQFIVISW